MRIAACIHESNTHLLCISLITKIIDFLSHLFAELDLLTFIVNDYAKLASRPLDSGLLSVAVYRKLPNQSTPFGA